MYVWELPVRISHWLMVVTILSLSITGYYMHSPYVIAGGRTAFVTGRCGLCISSPRSREHFCYGWSGSFSATGGSPGSIDSHNGESLEGPGCGGQVLRLSGLVAGLLYRA